MKCRAFFALLGLLTLCHFARAEEELPLEGDEAFFEEEEDPGVALATPAPAPSAPVDVASLPQRLVSTENDVRAKARQEVALLSVEAKQGLAWSLLPPVQSGVASDAAEAQFAAEALAELGAGAGPVIPALTQLLGQCDAKKACEPIKTVLKANPAAAAPPLTAALSSTDAAGRRFAADLLAQVGLPFSQGAAPQLRTALTDPDGGVRAAAALALGSMGPAAAPSAPLIAQMVEKEPFTPDPGSPHEAGVKALRQIGSPDALKAAAQAEAAWSENRLAAEKLRREKEAQGNLKRLGTGGGPLKILLAMVAVVVAFIVFRRMGNRLARR